MEADDLSDLEPYGVPCPFSRCRAERGKACTRSGLFNKKRRRRPEAHPQRWRAARRAAREKADLTNGD